MLLVSTYYRLIKQDCLKLGKPDNQSLAIWIFQVFGSHAGAVAQDACHVYIIVLGQWRLGYDY